MKLGDVAIAPSWVAQWKEVLSDACGKDRIDPDDLGDEQVAAMVDGSLQVWITWNDKVIAQVSVPRDQWVLCEQSAT